MFERSVRSGSQIARVVASLLAVLMLLFAGSVRAQDSPRVGVKIRTLTAELRKQHKLAKDVKGKPDLTRFVPSFCTFDPACGDLPQVKTVPSQGSGDLASFSRSNCFLVVPEGADRLKAGSTVSILLM